MNKKNFLAIWAITVFSLSLISCATIQIPDGKEASSQWEKLTIDQRTIIRFVIKATELTIINHRQTLKDKGVALKRGTLIFNGNIIKGSDDLIIRMAIIFKDAKDKPFVYEKLWSPCPKPYLSAIQEIVDVFVNAAMEQMIIKT